MWHEQAQCQTGKAAAKGLPENQSCGGSSQATPLSLLVLKVTAASPHSGHYVQ